MENVSIWWRHHGNSQCVSISPRHLFCCRGCKKITHISTGAAWRLWYHSYVYELNRKWGTGNCVISMLLHWHWEIGFHCVRIMKLALKSFHIFGDITPYVYMGRGHLTQSTWSKLHNTLRVMMAVVWLCFPQGGVLRKILMGVCNPGFRNHTLGYGDLRANIIPLVMEISPN